MQRARESAQNPADTNRQNRQNRVSSVSSVPTEAQKPQRPQSCDSCAHISKARTCLEPVAAGVAEHFHIVWCDLLNGHGRRCTAYAPKDHK